MFVDMGVVYSNSLIIKAQELDAHISELDPKAEKRDLIGSDPNNSAE